MKKDNFFIGWSDEMPAIDRRFFFAGGLALLGTAGVGAFALARHQNAPGTGTWNMGDIQTFTGIATAEPYAMLRTSDIDGVPRTALLSCMGKCGVAARIGSHAGNPVSIRGSLIRRGENVMIAVVDDIDWIAPATTALPAGLAFPEMLSLGQVKLSGEILDSKCWFGAMNPAEGKVHKSCASLCIRGGLPPAFFAKDKIGREALMIMTDNGAGHGHDILPFVADPVSVEGNVKQWGNLLLLDGPVSSISRL